VIGLGHRALGGDGDADRVAVLDQRRQVEPDAAVEYVEASGEGLDRLFEARSCKNLSRQAYHDQAGDPGDKKLPLSDREKQTMTWA
jgi:hypothetical protein